jgi:hypothetical protein
MLYPERKVINWSDVKPDGTYEVFLECLHSVMCHIDVDKYPEAVPRVCECRECNPIGPYAEKFNYVLC